MEKKHRTAVSKASRPCNPFSRFSFFRHRHVNVNQKRYAVASALAATAVPALVMARGHRVEEVPELPLVVDTSLETCTKTASALATLTALGAAAEVEKVRRCIMSRNMSQPDFFFVSVWDT